MNTTNIKNVIKKIIKDRKKWYLVPILLLILILVFIVEFATWGSVFDYTSEEQISKRIIARIVIYASLILIVFIITRFILSGE